ADLHRQICIDLSEQFRRTPLWICMSYLFRACLRVQGEPHLPRVWDPLAILTWFSWPVEAIPGMWSLSYVDSFQEPQQYSGTSRCERDLFRSPVRIQKQTATRTRSSRSTFNPRQKKILFQNKKFPPTKRSERAKQLLLRKQTPSRPCRCFWPAASSTLQSKERAVTVFMIRATTSLAFLTFFNHSRPKASLGGGGQGDVTQMAVINSYACSLIPSIALMATSSRGSLFKYLCRQGNFCKGSFFSLEWKAEANETPSSAQLFKLQELLVRLPSYSRPSLLLACHSSLTALQQPSSQSKATVQILMNQFFSWLEPKLWIRYFSLLLQGGNVPLPPQSLEPKHSINNEDNAAEFQPATLDMAARFPAVFSLCLQHAGLDLDTSKKQFMALFNGQDIPFLLSPGFCSMNTSSFCPWIQLSELRLRGSEEPIALEVAELRLSFPTFPEPMHVYSEVRPIVFSGACSQAPLNSIGFPTVTACMKRDTRHTKLSLCLHLPRKVCPTKCCKNTILISQLLSCIILQFFKKMFTLPTNNLVG
ncbi:Hypothetical predicted protein, partial [Podarcis lilfordi]